MTAPRGNGFADSPEEELLLALVAVAAFVVVVGSAAGLWLAGTSWLVEHGVLVPADSGPIVEIPGAAGAGLDGPRVAVAAAVIAAVIAIIISAARRAVVRRREEFL